MINHNNESKNIQLNEKKYNIYETFYFILQVHLKE